MKNTTTVPFTAALPDIGITLPTLVAKELRVTLPIALGGALCLALGLLFAESPIAMLLYLAYPVICSSIVAMAFGHDFMYRTISSALALPISRRKVWWARVFMCSSLLLPLLLINLAIVHFPILWALSQGRAVKLGLEWNVNLLQWFMFFAVQPVAALCLAPWLTIVSRSVMFGIVISTGIPFVVTRMLGFFGPQQHMWVYFSTPLSLLLILGAALSYRRFLALEAMEADVAITAKRKHKVAAQTPMRRSHSLVSLIKKELMLQRLPAVIALLSIALVFLVSKDHAALLSIVYPAAIVLLVGSIASADERRMGLIPSQVIQPIPFPTQWLAKISVAYIIAIIFGVILPGMALLIKTDELRDLSSADILSGAPLVFGGVLALLSITIYISSISENGVRALLGSIFVLIISLTVGGAVYNAFGTFTTPDPNTLHNFINLQFQARTFVIASIGLVVLALYFAMQNHRFLERSSRRLFRQVGALVIYALAAVAVISLLQ